MVGRSMPGKRASRVLPGDYPEKPRATGLPPLKAEALEVD
jgi:hypothetical protein